MLYRCGRATPRLLPGGAGQLGAGVVTWVTLRGSSGHTYHWALHALMLGSGREFTWRFVFPPERDRMSVGIQHTGRAVYVNETDPYHGTYTVLRAALPRTIR
jgi:hypothetical protein